MLTYFTRQGQRASRIVIIVDIGTNGRGSRIIWAGSQACQKSSRIGCVSYNAGSRNLSYICSTSRNQRVGGGGGEVTIEIEFSQRYFCTVRDSMYTIPPPNYTYDPALSKEKLV